MTVSDEEKAEESYINYRNAHCKITRNEINHHLRKDWRKSGIDRHRAYTDGYLDGLAEGRKEVTYMKAEEYEEYLNVYRENEELKVQIEKMKCCENCKHHSFWGEKLKCNLPYDEEFKCRYDKNKWELADD